jgi:hypothetical protein
MTLVVALIALGTGLLAIFAVFSFLCILTFLAFFQSCPVPAYVRRSSWRRSTRAPPRF